MLRLYAIAVRVAVVTGPAAGAVAQAHGYEAVMVLSIVVTLAGLLLGLWTYAKTRERHERFSGLVRVAHMSTRTRAVRYGSNSVGRSEVRSCGKDRSRFGPRRSR